ncbi:hypothetical protein LXL04_001300 [Taraxacum kok-saghyz]
MMRLFGSLLASSSPSKQPLLLLERSVAAYLLTANHSRFFSHQPTPIPDQKHSFLQTDEVVTDFKAKITTNAISVMSITNVKPDKPTPDNLRSHKLSLLDQIHSPSYVPFVFFYQNNDNSNINNDKTVFERSKLMKKSLSETLTRFYPMAGKFIDDSHIDCNDEGAYYIETQVAGTLSSYLKKPDYRSLQELLPMPPNLKEPMRGYYLVMIQVNFFNCGGIAIGMCNFHKLIDGGTYSTFLNSWALASKLSETQDKVKIASPSFPSSTLFSQTTQAPKYPAYPVSSLAIWSAMYKTGKSSMKRFVFSSSSISTLKEKANESGSSSRVVAVISLIWKCAMKQHAERESVLQIAVNLRGKFSPPLPQNTVGNFVWNAVATSDPNQEPGLKTMVKNMNSGIVKVGTGFVEGFKGEQGPVKLVKELKKLGEKISSHEVEYYSASSMCRSGINEADFGWGKPVWVFYGNLTENLPLYTNAILLMDTSEGDGIEAWVTLSREDMEVFECDPDILLYASVEPSPLPC